MPVIGITGGIATGKSTFASRLAFRLSAELFDSDRAVHGLLEGDPTVRQSVESAFGSDIYDSAGKPDRARLRELVFADSALRVRLENILHPVIRARWMALGEQARLAGAWLLVDIPLLYETAAESHFDRTIVVACSLATQRARLFTRRALSAAIADRIIDSQLDLTEKIKRADHLIWNDSTPACLEAQADLLAARLTDSYG